METWKDIEGYEGLYQVSNTGIVRSLKLRTMSGLKERIKILNLNTDTSGYAHVTFTKNGNRKTFKVHRLVCQAFVPNVENKKEVNHINGNKLDNNVKNLEWVTRAENMRHASENNLLSKESFRDVQVIGVKNGTTKVFKNKKECSKFFGFQYWWYHNQVKYFGEPFEHEGWVLESRQNGQD